MGRAVPTGICNGTSCWDGRVTWRPQVGQTTQSPLASHSPSVSCTCWIEAHYTWNGAHTIERGGRRGPSVVDPAPSLSPCAWQCCLHWPVCMVHTTRSSSGNCLPPLLKARYTHSICHRFSHLAPILVPSLEDIIALLNAPSLLWRTASKACPCWTLKCL